MATSNFLLAFTIICSFACTAFADNVPVLLWKNFNDEKSTDKMIPSLSILNANHFQNLVKEQRTDSIEKIIVFVADALRTEDFKLKTAEGVTCYEQLAKIPKKTYSPAVTNAVEALRQLNETAENVYITTTGEFNEDIGSNQLIFVSMPERLHEESAEAYHSRLDRIIAKLVDDFQKTKVLFILTARKSGQEIQHHSRKARAIAQSGKAVVANSNAKTFKNANLFVYFTDITEIINKTARVVEFTSLNVVDVTANSLKAELKGDRLQINLNLAEAGSTWYVSSVTVNDNTVQLQTLISAPVKASFKCTPAIYLKVNGSQIDGVFIQGLQIEPKFGDGGDPLKRFSHAHDCVGFTSAAIWAGLFITFLLLGILTVGISWIMDIRTMDRFDDPKGKTITVNASD